MIKKLIRYLPIIILAAAFSSCTSIQQNNRFYRDQRQLVCTHNPEYDGKNFQIYKYAVYIPSEVRNKQISDSLAAAIKSSGKDFLDIIPYEILKKKAVKQGHAERMEKINTSYNKTGTFTEKDIKILGDSLKFDFLLIPIIRDITTNDDTVYSTIENSSNKGGYFWPDFGVIENQKSGFIQTEIYIFDVKKGTFSGHHTDMYRLLEYYDTPDLFQKKIQAIDHENRLRVNENNHRREIEQEKREERERERREREKQRQNSKESGLDLFFDVLDLATEIMSDIDDYDLKMVPRPQFKQPVFKNQSDIESALIKNSISNAFGKYMSRFDGITDSGITTTGTGTFKFTNGDIYTGQWENSRAHGTGTYKYAGGAEYTGEFADGMASGHGIYKDIDSNKFEGEWVDGEKPGKGEYTFYDGTAVSAVCDHGRYKKMVFRKKISYRDQMNYTGYIRGRIGRIE